MYLYGYFLPVSSISLMVKRVSIFRFLDVLTYSFALYFIEAFLTGARDECDRGRRRRHGLRRKYSSVCIISYLSIIIFFILNFGYGTFRRLSDYRNLSK